MVSAAGLLNATLAYDPLGRLQETAGASGAELRYDPMGRLWQTSKAGAVTQFLYDGDQLAAEYDGSGAMKWRYFFGPGTDEPILADPGGALNCSGTRFLHSNHQGSIVALADCWGTRQAINAYDEYGLPKSEIVAGELINLNEGRFQYTGQAWIPELGMYHYKARIYSPTLGRFLQTDPVGYEDQVNLYAYVGNDPVNMYDDTGSWSKKVHNRIFDLAVGKRFNGLEISQIKRVSRYQDFLGPNAKNNAAHFLRDPGESVAQAEAKFRNYINNQVEQGRRNLRDGNKAHAQAAFARASHAAQDYYSPAHNDNGHPAVYKDDPAKTSLGDAVSQGHSPVDWSGKEGSDDLTSTTEAKMIQDTRAIYDRIFNHWPR